MAAPLDLLLIWIFTLLHNLWVKVTEWSSRTTAQVSRGNLLPNIIIYKTWFLSLISLPRSETPLIIKHQRHGIVQPGALSGAALEMCHLRDEWLLCLHVSCPKQISRLEVANL